MKVEINTMLQNIIGASRSCIIIEMQGIRYYIPNRVFDILMRIRKSVTSIELNVINKGHVQLLNL